VTGFDRNHRLVCAGLSGWDPSIRNDMAPGHQGALAARFAAVRVRAADGRAVREGLGRHLDSLAQLTFQLQQPFNMAMPAGAPCRDPIPSR
jgi:hypothetical protein